MVNIQIVTDSSAHFTTAHVAHQPGITIVPNRITIGSKVYREGVDLSADELMRVSTQAAIAPKIDSPTEADFVDVYRQLMNECDAIISIHPSRKIYPSWERANAAAFQIAGARQIVVIDSQTISAAQAMLVRIALRAAQEMVSLDDAVRRVRGAIERIYSVFYVDSLTSVLQNDILSQSHVFLGAMLGVKPFLTIEDGSLRPIEKVRTRPQAIERLVEFVVEFTDIEEVVILQSKSQPGDQTRQLQDRLAAEFPNRHFPYAPYGFALTALIGTEATGVALLESETEYLNDDF
ncbi:MAG: hypothetical protein CL610_19575 [Anaerolineaceae bacterium]|nr:hypothetical protein [Anaerolineaceae bacterium]